MQKKEGRQSIVTCMTHKLEKVKEFIRVLEEALTSQYKCSSEMGIPQKYHLQCCFADLWQKTGRQRIGLRPTWMRYSPSLTKRDMPLPPIKAPPVRGHSKCLGRPKAKSNRFQGVAQMTFGFSCAIAYRSVLTQAI